MVEASTNLLSACVLLQPMVIPNNAVDVTQLKVLKIKSLKDVTIPVGTVIGHLCITDVVTTMTKQQPVTEEFDASLNDFGELPVTEEWKTRHRQKLSESADFFSVHELDVGLAKVVTCSVCLSDPRPFFVNAPDTSLQWVLMMCGVVSESY